MHTPHQSYFEEDKATPVFDSTIMRWLWKYIKPHMKIILLNFLLVILLTGFRLALPYIYKRGIDRYISPTASEVLRPDEQPERIKKQPHVKSGKRIFADLSKIRQSLIGKLEQDSVISSKNYFLIKKTDETSERIKNLEYLDSEEYFIASRDEMAKLSLVDRMAIRKGDLEGIKKLAIIYLILVFLIFIINYGQAYQIQWVGQKISYSIRENIIKKYTTLPYSFFQKNPVGRLVTRASNDVKALNEFFSEVLVYVGSQLLTVLGILGIMFFLSPKLFFVVLGILPIIVYLTFLFRKKARKVYREVRMKLAKINSKISESISGIPVIQAFVQEDRQEREFEEINVDYFDSTYKMLRIYAIFRPLISFVRSLGIAGLIWFGGKGIIGGIVSFGTLVAFISYLQRLFRPISQLSEQYNIMQRAMAAGERVYNIMENDKNIPNPEIANNPDINGEITFENVWFSYDDEQWALKDVSFKVKPGEKVGIVGYTGSGKTTIIKLLQRLYDVDKGNITVNGVDIREMEKEYLRRHIATVAQEPFLFSGTLRKNVEIWRDVDKEQLQNALKVSNLKKVLERKDIDLDMEVTEEGGGLSIGEKQLVTFARALIQNSPILVLDEATANIDPETEHLIQQALFRMIRGRTSLIIAHRLATLKRIDSLIVVHKGEIVQRGTHQELINEDGIYRALYKLQEIA